MNIYFLHNYIQKMEAQAQAQALPPPLESLAKKLHEKRPMDCKDAIDALSPEERTAILDALVELVIKGTQSDQNTRLLANCLSFFPQEDVFGFFQRIRTGELLRQFCSFFDEYPEFYCLVRMSKILLTYSQDNFLRKILMILNEKRYMGVPIGIETLRFLEKEMTSPRTRETTIELREKILNFLWPMEEKTVRVILRIRPTEPFDLDVWIIRTRQIIAQYKAQQQRSE
jgi:hypothetical protein